MDWTVVLAFISLQVWMLFMFVKGAQIDVTEDKSDFVCTWQCPTDEDGYENRSDVTKQG